MFTRKNQYKKNLFNKKRFISFFLILLSFFAKTSIQSYNDSIDKEIEVIAKPGNENKNVLIEENGSDYCVNIIKRNLNGILNMSASNIVDIKEKLERIYSELPDESRNRIVKRIGFDYFVKMHLKGKTYFLEIVDMIDNSIYSSEVRFEKMGKMVCNKITNNIYEEIYGINGFFDKKILLMEEKIFANKMVKKIAIIDVNDSNDKIYIHGSNGGKEILMTPDYSEKRKEVVYSFISKPSKKGNPSWNKIGIIDLKDKKHYDIASKCTNLKNKKIFSPKFSKDGEGLFFSTLEDKNDDSYIYYIDLDSCNMRQLTKKGISVSPTATYDKKYLVYQSDKDIFARPNIYITNLENRFEMKVTNEGVYHQPEVSKNGSRIIFVKKSNNNSYLSIIDTKTMDEKILYSEFIINNPSISPDGNFILFSARKRYSKKSTINIVDYNGNLIKVIQDENNYNDPVWV